MKSSIIQQEPLEPLPTSKLSSLAKLGLGDRNPLMTRSLASVQTQGNKPSTPAALAHNNKADGFLGTVANADIHKRIMTKQLEASIQMRKFNIRPADRVDSLRGFTQKLNPDTRMTGGVTPSSLDQRLGRRAGESRIQLTPSSEALREQEASQHTQPSTQGNTGNQTLSRHIQDLNPYDCWAGSKAEYLKNKRKFERPMVL